MGKRNAGGFHHLHNWESYQCTQSNVSKNEDCLPLTTYSLPCKNGITQLSQKKACHLKFSMVHELKKLVPHVCKYQEKSRLGSAQRNPSHKWPSEYEVRKHWQPHEAAPTNNSPVGCQTTIKSFFKSMNSKRRGVVHTSKIISGCWATFFRSSFTESCSR